MKTNETSKVICNHCNKEKEGVQTGICNHCGKFGLTNNELSMKKIILWWSNLSSLSKTQLCDTNTEFIGIGRRWETLTFEEIETLYAFGELAEGYPKVTINKKFTSFNEEKFKAYANKFSQEDKVKMLQWLATDLMVLSLIDKSLRPIK